MWGIVSGSQSMFLLILLSYFWNRTIFTVLLTLSLFFPPLLAKSETSWESPKQIKKKKKARRETWIFFFPELDMCLQTLSWRLCCLCNNLWTCTEFYINLNQFLKQNCEHNHRKNGIKGKLIYEIKRSAELEDTWGKSFQSNKNDLNLRILSWFYNSALFTTDCSLSHLQLRNKGFWLERGLPTYS